MKEVKIDQFSISGPSVRTNNAAETGDSGKIAGLWANFYSTQSAADKTIYGLYSDYESDASGDFTVTAGTKDDAGGDSGVLVQAGTYLEFPVEGEMPAAIINAWKNVWDYFSNSGPYERLYKTDFEQYNSPTSAAIYIGIRA